MKLKSFCTTKEILSNLKRQPSEWETIIAKRSKRQRIYLKNMQATPAAQF